MSDPLVVIVPRTVQLISARVLAECRRTYGATIDDRTLQAWVSSALDTLLTDQTRVTQFVPLLAMRDIRELADRYVTDAA